MNLAQTLLNWYHDNKRDLPWRSTNDPYIIWLSEVILQQTRVDQGLPYFEKFAETYPTVSHFAEASEDEILKHWQGLGYYSRGRNMHKTAKIVMEEYGGYFPNSFEQLIKLKGIGDYTASAISSFSANEPRAVLDGNVFRFLSRFLGIDEPINTSRGKKLFSEVASSLLDTTSPGDYNQAIMEFGSQQCRPQNPICVLCPFSPECIAYKENRVSQLPVKVRPNPVRNRYFTYLLVVQNNQILMQKRVGKDIWHNLYQLPLYEMTNLEDIGNLMEQGAVKERWGQVNIKSKSPIIKHLLSHQRIHAQFLEVSPEKVPEDDGYFWIEDSRLADLALPKLIFDFLKKFLN